MIPDLENIVRDFLMPNRIGVDMNHRKCMRELNAAFDRTQYELAVHGSDEDYSVNVMIGVLAHWRNTIGWLAWEMYSIL